METKVYHIDENVTSYVSGAKKAKRKVSNFIIVALLIHGKIRSMYVYYLYIGIEFD